MPAARICHSLPEMCPSLSFVLLMAIAMAAVGLCANVNVPPNPARALGAACECELVRCLQPSRRRVLLTMLDFAGRCCWEIAVGRYECSNRYHEFLLRPAQCDESCSDAACAKRYGCAMNHAVLHATCRRGLPRALALLAFCAAAMALLAFACLRRRDSNPSPVTHDLGWMERRASYSYDAIAPVKADDAPPNTDVISAAVDERR